MQSGAFIGSLKSGLDGEINKETNCHKFIHVWVMSRFNYYTIHSRKHSCTNFKQPFITHLKIQIGSILCPFWSARYLLSNETSFTQITQQPKWDTFDDLALGFTNTLLKPNTCTHSQLTQNHIQIWTKDATLRATQIGKSTTATNPDNLTGLDKW